MRILFRFLLAIFLFLPITSFATSASLINGFKSIASDLRSKIDHRLVSLDDLSPLVVVSIVTEDKVIEPSDGDLLISSLIASVPNLQIRLCQSCLSQSVHHQDGTIKIAFLQKDEDSIRSILESFDQIKSGIWVSLRKGVVSYKIANLKDHRVITATTLVDNMPLKARSYSHYTKADALERMAKGQGIYHTYFDASFYPNYHLAFSFLEQWGELAQYQTGLSLSFVAPFLGFGPVFYQSFSSMNHTMIGVKLLISIPTALAQSVSKESSELLDPFINLLGVARLPMPGSSGRFSLFGFISLRGSIGLGVSF